MSDFTPLFFIALAAFLMSAAVLVIQLSNIWRRKILWEHNLGRDRLNAVITAARDAGMVFESGDYAEVGKTSEFKLSVEFESGLECSVEITQKFDQVDIRYKAIGYKNDMFIDTTKSVSEAIGMTKMIDDAQWAWGGRRERKMAEAG